MRDVFLYGCFSDLKFEVAVCLHLAFNLDIIEHKTEIAT